MTRLMSSLYERVLALIHLAPSLLEAGGPCDTNTAFVPFAGNGNRQICPLAFSLPYRNPSSDAYTAPQVFLPVMLPKSVDVDHACVCRSNRCRMVLAYPVLYPRPHSASPPPGTYAQSMTVYDGLAVPLATVCPYVGDPGLRSTLIQIPPPADAQYCEASSTSPEFMVDLVRFSEPRMLELPSPEMRIRLDGIGPIAAYKKLSARL
ncbi:hypothetical protein F5Y15DRAFT_385848 [Xylariaceae sp. FL0016]|nr:hypothetical protein F5Y15DRAFT_385848 [Xylariaceae sp. FL0016]